MLFLALLACTCVQPEEPPTPEGDLAPIVEVEEDESRATAIELSCQHIEECGCLDQTQDQCITSSTGTNLPAYVYRCMRFVDCERLCDTSKTGSPGKGTVECVEPWVKEQIPGGPKSGLKKNRTTTFVPKDPKESDE
jgi:hypothetical protein